MVAIGLWVSPGHVPCVQGCTIMFQVAYMMHRGGVDQNKLMLANLDDLCTTVSLLQQRANRHLLTCRSRHIGAAGLNGVHAIVCLIRRLCMRSCHTFIAVYVDPKPTAAKSGCASYSGRHNLSHMH